MKDFNWQCAAQLHPWTAWADVTQATPATTSRPLAVVQKRTCPKCGKVQLRTEKAE